MTAAANRDKLLVLEGIRGIAAIFIAIRHTVLWWGPVRFGESYLAVDIFFLLSGLVLAHAYDAPLASGRMTASGFMGRRLLRIYPLYIIGSTLGLGVAVAWHDPAVPNVLVAAVFAVFMVPDYRSFASTPYPLDYPVWSLAGELIVNAAYAFGIALLSTRRLAVLCAVAAAVLAYGVVTIGNANLGSHHDDALFGLVRTAFSFFLGVMIGRNLDRVGGWFAAIPLPAMALVALAAASFLPAVPEGPARAAYDLAMILLGFPVLIAVAARAPVRGWEAGTLRTLGLISYPLYVLQVPVSIGLQNLAMSALIRTDMEDYAPWAGAVLLIGMCALAYVVAVKVDLPLRAWIGARFVATKARRVAPAS